MSEMNVSLRSSNVKPIQPKTTQMAREAQGQKEVVIGGNMSNIELGNVYRSRF